MQSFEEFRKSIPFESKRELFSELRNNWRVTDADLRAFIATHGEDAVVFCIYEAVGSGGFDVRIDQWHVLRELLPNHPQIAPLSIRLGLDDGLSADGAEQFARDLLTEKTTSLKDTRFVTESEWAPVKALSTGIPAR